MDNEKAARLYGELMKEVKYRIEAIDHVLAKRVPLRNKICEELCYLQLRMICEVMALACLVIHGDVKGAQGSQIQKAYQADWIMRTLAELHPNFYPRPMRAQDEPATEPGGLPSVIAVTEGFLTQAEHVRLYQLCGDKLHRGRAKNLMKGADAPNYTAIKVWRDKIVLLLNRHAVALVDGKNECWFIMRHAGHGQVAWNIMQRVDETAS